MHIIDDRLSVVISKLRYVANTTTLPYRLPPEHLRGIFAHLCPDAHYDWTRCRTPPYADLCAVSNVCRHWREIAISAPELWTYIILSASPGVSEIQERSVARLCILRSGVRPLDLFCTTSFSYLLNAGGLIPDRRRLRGLVYEYEDPDELFDLLLAAPYLERLEIIGPEEFLLHPLPSEVALPRLRELVISNSTPWPNHQFGSLTSLCLLHQEEPDAEIYSIIDTLRHSPHLEKLVLERASLPPDEEPLLPERDSPAVPLHSLTKLHVCRFSETATRILLGLLDLPPRGIFMQFTDSSDDFESIFSESMKP